MKEQQLSDLSIFALRELARRTGVSSPTSKRKSDLIAEIIEIQSGKKQPVASSKQGRPPKGFILNLDNIIEKDNKVLSFKQNEEDLSAETYTVSGYVEKLNNNVGFLLVKENEKFKNYFIPSTAFKGEVLSGDYVTVLMAKTEDGAIVKSILTVEGCDILNLQNRLKYEELEHIGMGEKIAQANSKFKDVEVGFGGNVYIYGKNNIEKTKHSIQFLNSCNADVKMYVNFALVDKFKVYLKDVENAEIFTADMIDEQDYVERIINVAIERAKRYLESGKNLVLLIDDVLTIKSINFNLLKSLMSLTKNTTAGSITIVAIMSDNQSVSIFEKLADKKFEIYKDGLVEF